MRGYTKQYDSKSPARPKAIHTRIKNRKFSQCELKGFQMIHPASSSRWILHQLVLPRLPTADDITDWGLFCSQQLWYNHSCRFEDRQDGRWY